MLWILPNTAGDQATSLSMPTVSTEGGYDSADIISGPRNYFWRSIASSAGQGIGYILPADLIVTHFVIARADWLVTQSGGNLRSTQRNSGGSLSYISGAAYTPLTAASLMGPKAQDLAYAVAPTVYRGYYIEFDSAGTEAMQISKFYPSVGFNFGHNPDILANPERQEDQHGQASTLFIPQRGYFPYETDGRITLSWHPVTRAVANEFLGLPQLLNWPIFLFDDAADLWPWKLEHVIVENIVETVLGQDEVQFTVTFQRLMQYE